MRWRHELCRCLGAHHATQSPPPAPAGGTLREPDRTAGPRTPALLDHAVRGYPSLCVPVVPTSWAAAATAPVPRQVRLPVLCHLAHIDWRQCSCCGASSRGCRNVAARRYAMRCGRGVLSLLLSSRREATPAGWMGRAMVPLRCSRGNPAMAAGALRVLRNGQGAMAGPSP